MPIHDWTRVPADIFRDFRQSWIVSIFDTMNRNLLPTDRYALMELFPV